MATMDTIRTVTVRGQSQGLDKVAGDLKSVAGAQRDVASSGQAMASVTDMSSRRTLSATAALQRLASAHDEAYRAEQQHAKATQVLERAAAQGLSGTREFAVAQAALAKMHHEAGEAAGFNRAQMMEATHVAKAFFDEIMAGQSPIRALQVEGGRIAQIFTEGQGGVGGTFKALAGLLGRAATGWVGLSIATATGVATIVGSAVAYEASQERIQRALEGTGRAAGMTVAQLQAVADAGARAGGISGSQGRGLAIGFAQHGFDADMTQSLVGASKRFGVITGQDTGEAGAKLGEIFEDPAKGLRELDRTFGLLDARLQTTVEHLVAQGDVEAARQVALDAYLKAQGEVTDQTWSFSHALSSATSAVGGTLYSLGHRIAAIFGGGTDQDNLEKNQALLAELQRADPSGTANADDIASVKAEIARLEGVLASDSAKARSDATAARDAALARELSLKVENAIHAALPEDEHARTLSDRLALLGRGLNTSGVAGDLGASAAQLTGAFQRTAVLSTFTDPNRRMAEDYQLALASADAFTLAEKAAVEARRAELAVLRETGDVSRAAVAAEMARNEAIAKANQDAEDSLEASRQNAALIGLSPFERSQQEIRNRFEGYGGLIDKASASRSDLDTAMRPVADDLHSAGESIAKAMRDAAATIAEAGHATTGPALPTFAAGSAAMAGAPPDIQAMIRDAAARTGTDPNVIAAIGQKENSYRLTGGTSMLGSDGRPSSAWGFGQLTNGAARDVAGAVPGFDKYDPKTAVFGAAEYLKILMDRNGGNLGAALNAYGGTPGYAADIARRSGSALARAPSSVMELPTIEVQGTRLPPAGAGAGPTAVAPIAATAAGTYRTQMGEELSSDVKARIVGPLQEANTALNARIALLGTENATLGQNAAAQQAAADARRLLSQYEAQDPDHAMGAEAWRKITDGVDLYRQKLQGAIQAEQDFQANQRNLVAAMDDVRDTAKGALSSFVGDVMNGKTALQGLHDAFSSISSKIAGKVEDSAIDMLFGKSGGPGGGIFGSGLSGLFGRGLGSSVSAPTSGGFFDLGMATGGWVSGPGTGTSDSVPAMLSNGEFVVHAAAAAQHVDLLHAINSGRLPGYAEGGFVGPAPVGAGGPGAAEDGIGGDVHIHNHFPGGIGDAHIESIARRATASGLASYDAKLSGRLAERKRRT